MMIYLIDKMKYNQYHTVETVPKPHRQIKGRLKINTADTQIRDCSRSWLGTGTLI